MTDLEATDPHLAVIVVNYGSSDLLERNLAPLARHTPNARVVVVDNSTSAAEQARCTDCAPGGLARVTMSDNAGFGAASTGRRPTPRRASVRCCAQPRRAIDADMLARLVTTPARPADLIGPGC